MNEQLPFGKRPVVISLCDRTGNAVRDWAAAGYECWCIDVQHQFTRDRTETVGSGTIRYVWGDARSWRPPEDIRPVFVFAFSPCTHIAGSGAAHFVKKGGYMLRDGLELFESCRQAASWSGAPYMLENPVGVLSSIPHIGKPNHYFDPYEYAGYLEGEERDREAYTKRTCLWTGNGFVMPATKPVSPVLGSKMNRLPPTADRADLRSVTPRGFALAVYLANAGKVCGGVA